METEGMEPGTDAKRLLGHRVAFTGTLASMTRAEAVELVRSHGGEWVTTVTNRTSMLIIGQDGFPLRKDGHLTLKLQKAQRLQTVRSLTILTEAEFLERLGLETPSCLERLSTAQLSRILQVPGERIRGWIRLGLVEPTETVQGIHYFNFRQVSWAKTLCDFAGAGISPERIRRSLQQLRQWTGDVEEPLEQLAVLERDGQLLLRLRDGHLMEPTGQGLLDFDEQPATMTIATSPRPRTAQEWYELGCAQETEGCFEEAAHAYRQALLEGGPNPDTCFNLANVLYAQGLREQAAERFRQTVELDRDSIEAWNNLGSVLDEIGEHEEAIEAFRQALRLNPQYADAHYNLADTLEKLGRPAEAIAHWQAYLHEDPMSPWGQYARRRLASREA